MKSHRWKKLLFGEVGIQNIILLSSKVMKLNMNKLLEARNLIISILHLMEEEEELFMQILSNLKKESTLYVYGREQEVQQIMQNFRQTKCAILMQDALEVHFVNYRLLVSQTNILGLWRSVAHMDHTMSLSSPHSLFPNLGSSNLIIQSRKHDWLRATINLVQDFDS